MTTDGYGPYRDCDGAVFTHFRANINYGVEMKKYGTLLEQEGERKYSPLVCTSCRRWVETGSRIRGEVTVNHAERQNLNVRLFNRRFTRLTLGFSKKLANLEHATALMVAFHNFCRTSKSLHKKATEIAPACPRTPAMAFGLTDHIWTIAELLATAG
jgi:hypothetical protein